ncbi:MAG: RluA family pseudouridine synthase [Caldisericia bacterium]|nr:RluA family pseudouridine synthase [Caldisericia bacterium]
MERRVIKLVSNEHGERLDSFLKKNLIEYSREYLKSLIKDGKVTVNGEIKKPSYKIKEKDIIEVIIPEPKELSIKPENLNIEIIYEDDDIAIVNKPQGMLTHPTGKKKENTLVNALLFHLKNLSQIGGVLRPGIVHRLDKDTSGLLVIAKNDFSHQILSRDLKERKIKRIYYALVKGEVNQNEGTISIPLTKNFKSKKFVKPSLLGKEAETHFKVIKRYKDFTLLEISLKTGRTHQIRVHLSFIGYPIVGDRVYGISIPQLKGQLLHAKKLILNHPRTGQRLEFDSPIPDYFENFLKNLQEFSK